MKISVRLVKAVATAMIFLLVSGATRIMAEENTTPTKPSGSTVGFSKFRARVETESNELEVTALFTLGQQSSGINPESQEVSLKVGNFSVAIPAGSFKATSIGWFKYEGMINGADLEVKIVPLGANRYGFRAEVAAKGLTTPTPGQTQVELSIDGNGGSMTAKVERSWL